MWCESSLLFEAEFDMCGVDVLGKPRLMSRRVLSVTDTSIDADLSSGPGRAPKVHITATTELNLPDALEVERRAFGSKEEAELVRQLLSDPTAMPVISLLAYQHDTAAGHILLTNATLLGHADLEVMILGPLAVVPERQRTGVGAALVIEALAESRERGVDLVFVLGIPEYYPRHGFRAPAEAFGFEPPYPLAEGDEQAWMVQELRPGVIGHVRGRVAAADSFMRPEYWRE